MRSRTVLPVVGTVAAVTALAVTVALVRPDGSHTPRPLRLAAGGVASGAADSTAAAPKMAASSGYTLTGTLPADRPGDAPAYTLAKGPADSDVVAALARALKAGTPVHGKDGWRAGGLFVSDNPGQSWWWSPCAADTPVSSGEQVACASGVGVGTVAPVPPPPDSVSSGGGSAPSAGSASGGSSSSAGSASGSNGTTTADAPPPASPQPASPEPAPPAMSKDEIRTAAAPVLDALGLDVADARVDAWPGGGNVTVGRTVGGLDAYGLETNVSVDQDGKVSGGGGYLGTPDKGDSYPLVTAQEAYDELPPMERTMMMCPVGPDGQGCVQPQPTEVTGAHLGLMVEGMADGDLGLLPAWLFEVKGWTVPLPVVAVQKQYLPDPEPVASDDPGVVPPDGGTTSTKPEPPGEVPPAPPVADPGASRTAFSFDKAARGTEPNQLVVTYGDSSSCPHENVTAEAKEDPTAVYVVLEADARDPKTICTDDYRIMTKTVTLRAPLGDRKVYDATTGKAVPLS